MRCRWFINAYLGHYQTLPECFGDGLTFRTLPYSSLESFCGSFGAVFFFMYCTLKSVLKCHSVGLIDLKLQTFGGLFFHMV